MTSNSEQLVRVTQYSSKIRELPIFKRISVDYPLLCRDAVARNLALVSVSLPDNFSLQVDSAYRTRKTSEFIWKKRSKGN